MPRTPKTATGAPPRAPRSRKPDATTEIRRFVTTLERMGAPRPPVQRPPERKPK